jgi:hypothetical protein
VQEHQHEDVSHNPPAPVPDLQRLPPDFQGRAGVIALAPMPAGTLRLVKGHYRKFLRTALVACPQCGREAMLDHEIAADGTVSPSVQCPFPGCSFHDQVQLLGWLAAP